MQPPRTLDDLLNDARSFPTDDLDAEDDTEEEWAARRLLAQDYADALQRGTSRGTPRGGFPQSAVGWPQLHTRGPGHPGPVPRRERAARELRALSAWAIRSPQAPHHIAGLATTHQINPDAAWVFACLLHLAERDDQAEVLWQFAAGAGKPASAECLYLLHITRGELRQARHWAHQAADLDTPAEEEPEQAGRPPTAPTRLRREHRPMTSPMLLRVWRALRRDTSPSISIETFHACAGTLSRALTAAVHSLKAEPSTEFGLLSWPDTTLAARMQECLT